LGFLESETSNKGTLSLSHSRYTEADPRLEPDGVAERAPPTAAEVQSRSVHSVHSIGRYTESQIRQMQNDDAMAGGMISTILTMAFVIFLFLTIGVNIWMQSLSR
jgi:hypothetical protein